MTPRRLEEKDLPTLDRADLQTIFAPLDPNEPPVKDQPRRWRHYKNNPINLVWLPAFIGLLTLEVWLQLPTALILLFLVVFTVILIALWTMVDKRM